MSSRIPPALDDEDRVVFGLTAQRGAYVLISALTVLVILKSSMPTGARLAVGAGAAVLGAVFGWGRWSSRAADLWFWDLALYLKENHRVRLQMKVHGFRPRPRTGG